MIINLYKVVAIENANTARSKRIEKTILAGNENKALITLYANHLLAKYAKAYLIQ